MSRMLVATVLLVGCSKGGPGVDPFDPNDVAELPNWMEDQIAGNENACDDSAAIPPQAKVATTFFAGYYEWDGDDDLAGNEFWVLYPDAELAATGFTQCTVVWDVFGSVGDPVGAADYSIEISASVDEGQTDCIEDELGQPVYVGEENFTITYDVVEQSNGTADVFFTSGTQLGRGEVDNRSLSWLSERDCKIF